MYIRLPYYNKKNIRADRENPPPTPWGDSFRQSCPSLLYSLPGRGAETPGPVFGFLCVMNWTVATLFGSEGQSPLIVAICASHYPPLDIITLNPLLICLELWCFSAQEVWRSANVRFRPAISHVASTSLWFTGEPVSKTSCLCPWSFLPDFPEYARLVCHDIDGKLLSSLDPHLYSAITELTNKESALISSSVSVVRIRLCM